MPASVALNVFCNFEGNGEVKLCVSNLVGDIMCSHQFIKNSPQAEFDFPINNMPDGVYNLSVIFKGNVISRKLFVIFK